MVVAQSFAVLEPKIVDPRLVNTCDKCLNPGATVAAPREVAATINSTEERHQ